MSVWYLDLDDEITDAVARLRAAKDEQVVLVLPPGSRIGTGRINFRLLAREAASRGLTLALVSGDAQVRALSAAAGLTAHATVGEAERALGLATGPEAPAGARSMTAASAGAAAAQAGDGIEPAGTRDGGSAGGRAEGYAVTPRTAAVAAGEAAIIIAPPSGREGARVVRRGPSTGRRVATWGTRGAVVGALAAGALYVGYLTLPTAAITLIPGSRPLPDQPVSIVASPNTPAVDAVAGVIPASRRPYFLTQAGTFDATQTRDVLTRAKGKVRFTSQNTVTSVLVEAGTRVWTSDGTTYRTLKRVTLPRWNDTDNDPKPAIEVEVEAIKPGTAGNTGPSTITNVNTALDQLRIKVTNPAPITNGTKTTVKTVARADCTAAQKALREALEADFELELQKPATPGLELHPDSGDLGDVAFSPTCEDLVGQQANTFQLTATTNASALEVDESVLEATAGEHFVATADPAVRIERESVEAERAGPAQVTTEQVTYPMSVTASVQLPVDPAAIRQEVAGKPVSEAQAILDRFGEATLVMWPDFIPNVPTDLNRITLTLAK